MLVVSKSSRKVHSFAGGIWFNVWFILFILVLWHVLSLVCLSLRFVIGVVLTLLEWLFRRRVGKVIFGRGIVAYLMQSNGVLSVITSELMDEPAGPVFNETVIDGLLSQAVNIYSLLVDFGCCFGLPMPIGVWVDLRWVDGFFVGFYGVFWACGGLFCSVLIYQMIERLC